MFKFGKFRGLPEIEKFLRSLPRGTAKVALPALAEWFIGNERRGLKHYEKYKYVSRAEAYPNLSFTTKDGRTIAGYKSLRQFRKVKAMIAKGEILPGYPRRTGNTQRGYVQRPTNGGYGVAIENKQKGAYYTRDDKGQARLNALAGWRKAADVIQTNLAGAIRHAQSVVSKWLKKQ